MYSFIKDLKELSYSQSFPSTGFIPRTFRSKIDFFRYNQLPPIKEEEGNVSLSDIKLRNISLFSQSTSDRSYEKCFKIDKANSYDENKRKKLTGEGWTKSEISSRSLLPEVNVNCLMNVDMKQQSIWNTSFGKRLINGKAPIPETLSSPMLKKPKKEDEKLGDNQRSKSVNSSQSTFRGRNIQFKVGHKMSQTKKKKVKSVQVEKKVLKTEKPKKSDEQEPSQTDTDNNTCKSETESAEILLKTDPFSSEFLADSLTMSHKSKNRKFLSHCVQNILRGINIQHTCEYCDEIFTKEEDLESHKKKHEREKETCILCNKVFYNPKDFTQHLLTHESVDKFSCKKCKKYFPSLKKYKAHCKQVHLMSLESAETENVSNSPEGGKELTPKYECKRCQLELESEENLRVHRRNHIRLDLMGAYLLSSKTI